MHLKKLHEKKLVTRGLFLEFDTINHEILYSKLYHYGICENPLGRLKKLLTVYNHSQVWQNNIGDTKSVGYHKGQPWVHHYFCFIFTTCKTVLANCLFKLAVADDRNIFYTSNNLQDLDSVMDNLGL